MSEENETTEPVESSAVAAGEIIAKAKAKKAATLKAIFDDNKSGRYSGPTDN